MTDPRESDLNVLQMQQITTVNVECVADMFIKKHSKRLFNPTMYSK